MRINDDNMAGVSSAGLGRAQAAEQVAKQEAARASAKGNGGRDEVALSGLSAKLQEMQPGSPEREARLAALAARFEAGRYEVDAEASAQGMIEEAEMKADVETGE